MANEQNLRPSEYRFTHEDSVKGGKASVEARRRRKAFAEAFEVLLSREFSDRNGNKLQGVDAIAAKAFQAAMDGDLKAIQMIRDTVGEQPVQQVEVSAQIPSETYERIERILSEEE